MKRMFFFALITMFVLVNSFNTVCAQWSSDPLLNTPVSVFSGEQTVPKLAVTPAGDSYLAWYDNRNGNYDIYMQYLNQDGEPQWTQNGIAISTHQQDTWVTDFDLAIDSSGNAIVAFNDIRDGGDWDVYVYKISSAGVLLWGNDGISISPANNTNFEAAPKIVQTKAGNTVITWFTEESGQAIRMQKISDAGSKLWGDDGVGQNMDVESRER